MTTNGSLNRKLRMALCGGGQGAFIGRVHATAAVLDETNENFILPLFVVVMVVVGALLWSLIPGLSSRPHDRGRLAGLGALGGLLAAGAALLVFFALLNGYSGV